MIALEHSYACLSLGHFTTLLDVRGYLPVGLSEGGIEDISKYR
jgi:hypothetical protein